MTDAPEDAIAKAERHVHEAEARVTWQTALVEELDRTGQKHQTDMARVVLTALRTSLVSAHEVLERERRASQGDRGLDDERVP
jgi:hypothetical protein